MLTQNQIIMREIHNEQPELTSSLNGRELLISTSDFNFLDEDTKSKLWQGANLQQTFFGEGLRLDAEERQEMTEDAEMLELLNVFYTAMIRSGIEYSEQPGANPHEILVQHLANGFSEITGSDMAIDDMYNFLNGLLDCETLAPWLLVSPVFGFSRKDI